jgi:hypothetical protein
MAAHPAEEKVTAGRSSDLVSQIPCAGQIGRIAGQ